MDNKYFIHVCARGEVKKMEQLYELIYSFVFNFPNYPFRDFSSHVFNVFSMSSCY